MANTYLPAQQYINAVFAELLLAENLGGLITPFSGEEFVGTLNDTLLYRTEAVTIARDYEFRTRNNPIIFDEIARNVLPLTIDQHMTVANKWTDEERTFDLKSIRREIARPMAKAMVRRFDAKILTALEAADWSVTNLDVAAPTTANETDRSALQHALAIKTKLDTVGCPKNGRKLVLGANAFLYFAASKATLAYDKSQALTVYQQGVYGTIAGMDVVDGTQFLGENDIIALHPSWAVLPNAAPENPQDLSFTERLEVGGYSARLAAQYHLPWASDALLLNTFWGISEIKDEYARHTAASATTANDGSMKGDIIIEDGRTKFTGKNARGGRGTFSQL